MGQAKQRKAEIENLKASTKTVKFFAIRHCEDGTAEWALAEVGITKNLNNKSDLLAHICKKDWLHKPPVVAIAEYLLLTKTYEASKMFNSDDIGYVINFHEYDENLSRQKGEKLYSCRIIQAMTRDKVSEYAELFAEEMMKTGEYSLQTDLA